MSGFNESDSYLSHLHSEHCRLDNLTKTIGDRFQQSQDGNWNRIDRPEIAVKLTALKDELSRHIGEEEHGGCIDEAISRLPSLAKEAQQLSVENDELRKTLWQVIHLVESGTRLDAEQAFRRFASQLRSHERHEAQVAEKGMNRFPFGER